MRIIHRKISLEKYRSRINGKLKSYNGSIVEEFGNNSNNYGLFPFDVVYETNNASIVLAYPTLMTRYYFCKRYNELLKNDSCCENNNYKDSIDYYEREIGTYDSEIGNKYEDMKATYEEYGGDKFYEWCNKILFDDSSDVKYNETFKNINEEDVKIDGLANTAHINLQILFTCDSNNLGELTTYEPKWEGGIDYRSQDTDINGAIISYDDEIWSLKKRRENRIILR